MKNALLLLTFLILSCQSKPHGEVRLGYDYPQGNCREVGQVMGSSGSMKDARKKALEDLKFNTAALSGNYVRVLAISAYNQAVRGVAYRCN